MPQCRTTEDYIHNEIGNIGLYSTVYAHSGATINSENSNSLGVIGGEFGGEVPTNFPTVMEQVDLHFSSNNEVDLTVDLILVDGGANDVDTAKILNPLTPFDLREEDISKPCRDDMKLLLEKLARKFPNAKIVITGYYTILSEKSDRTTSVAALLTALGIKTVAGADLGTGNLSTMVLAGGKALDIIKANSDLLTRLTIGLSVSDIIDYLSGGYASSDYLILSNATYLVSKYSCKSYCILMPNFF